MGYDDIDSEDAFRGRIVMFQHENTLIIYAHDVTPSSKFPLTDRDDLLFKYIDVVDSRRLGETIS